MRNNSLSPIVLFTYNRIDHLKLTISNLKNNDLARLSELIIFSDGAKTYEDISKVLKIRNYLKQIKGFKKIIIIERYKNFGLSHNIINGVTSVLKKYKKIIVLEDDLLVNKYFLRYMNKGLNLYRKDKNVASIHGYIYPISNMKNEINTNTFFIKGADCWGWGTWLRAWSNFNKDGKILIKILEKKNLVKNFNFNNSYNYYQMLKDQVNKKNDSWAIRWYASCFLKNMYTLYPVVSFVKNIGIDSSGQNSKFDLLNIGNKKLTKTHYKIIKQPVVESALARTLIENFFKKKKIFIYKNILKKILNV
jgi:hypothetical protein